MNIINSVSLWSMKSVNLLQLCILMLLLIAPCSVSYGALPNDDVRIFGTKFRNGEALTGNSIMLETIFSQSDTEINSMWRALSDNFSLSFLGRKRALVFHLEGDVHDSVWPTIAKGIKEKRAEVFMLVLSENTTDLTDLNLTKALDKLNEVLPYHLVPGRRVEKEYDLVGHANSKSPYGVVLDDPKTSPIYFSAYQSIIGDHIQNKMFMTDEGESFGLMFGFNETHYLDPATEQTRQASCIILMTDNILNVEITDYNKHKQKFREILSQVIAPGGGCYAEVMAVFAEHDDALITDALLVDPRSRFRDNPMNSILDNDSTHLFDAPLYIDGVGDNLIDVNNGVYDWVSKEGGELRVVGSGKYRQVEYRPPVGKQPGDQDLFYYRSCALDESGETFCGTSSATITFGLRPPKPNAPLTGVVFNDNSKNAPHNGEKDQGEKGLATRTIIITDGIEERVTQTNALGEFSILLPDSWHDSTVTVTVKPKAGWDNVSESLNHHVDLSFTSTDGGQNGEAEDHYQFGQIKSPILDQNNNKSIEGEATTAYFAHRLSLHSPSIVTFNIVEKSAPWPVTIYQDLNCDGKLTQDEPIISTPIIVTEPERKICLVSKVELFFPSHGVAFDFLYYLAAQVSPINHQAIADSGDISETGQELESGLTFNLENQDRLTANNFGKLTLRTTVKNITENGKETTHNSAKPGDILEYKIYFSNLSKHPISNVRIFDSVPEYSQLISNLLPVSDCGLSNSLECQLNLPLKQDNDIGYRGKICWQLDDELKPSEEGVVSYRIKVDE
ncbi:hypothetical protein L0B53_03545 [Vibrio sp. SS-MA-C1-2]|uniref:hypothetical protein n=1 Tax=Vibrio sp. SS-MA-C1-2 TaxID=2908646 RepID=UPI001F3A535C|nr:hypothetical protein [Vibrio sp. SS-MA-C1-2]UJF17025.1 hypothetical protein L0B53_03545 [Vibrio sp. SS-MA-C1-2]